MAGCRVRRSSAQDSPVAVVSCPATSNVISWSRSSTSVIARPSSSAARTSIASTSVRSARCGSARRSAISAYSRRSASSMCRRTPRQGRRRCRSGLAMASIATELMFSSRGSTRRSAASRAGSLAPMTVRRITSRVISDIRGATGNSVPTGQLTTLAAAISAITSAWRATASRWNGGIMSPRRSRCTSSSITSTEVSPSSPRSIEFASPAW